MPDTLTKILRNFSFLCVLGALADILNNGDIRTTLSNLMNSA